MKKRIAFMLSVVLLFSVVSVTGVTAEEGSLNESVYSGTPDTSWYTDAVAKAGCFTITTADQLAGLAILVKENNVKFEEFNISLGADLRFNEGDASTWAEKAPTYSWIPIGNENSIFYGNFDGRGHTVSGLYCVDDQNKFIGMFGVVAYGTIENLIVKNSYFSCLTAAGGVIANIQIVKSTVRNIYCDSIVKTVESYAGGIIGTVDISDCTFSNLVFSGSVDCGKEYGAGIVAFVIKKHASFINCVNEGDIRSVKKAGGITGIIREGEYLFQNCVSAGTVAATYVNASGTPTNEHGMLSGALYAPSSSSMFRITVKDFIMAEGTGYPTALYKDVSSSSQHYSFEYTQVDETGKPNVVDKPKSVPVENLKGENAISAMTPAYGGWVAASGRVALPVRIAVLFGEKQLASNRAVCSQTKFNNDSTMDIRFVATLDAMDYEEIGFEISYLLPGETNKTTVLKKSYSVYASLIGNDSQDNLIERSAAGYSAEYLYTYTVKSIPTTGLITFTVKPYTKKAGSEAVFGEAYEAKYFDGAFVYALVVTE